MKSNTKNRFKYKRCLDQIVESRNVDSEESNKNMRVHKRDDLQLRWKNPLSKTEDQIVESRNEELSKKENFYQTSLKTDPWCNLSNQDNQNNGPSNIEKYLEPVTYCLGFCILAFCAWYLGPVMLAYCAACTAEQMVCGGGVLGFVLALVISDKCDKATQSMELSSAEESNQALKYKEQINNTTQYNVNNQDLSTRNYISKNYNQLISEQQAEYFQENIENQKESQYLEYSSDSLDS
jgi:gas vesicle protein